MEKESWNRRFEGRPSPFDFSRDLEVDGDQLIADEGVDVDGPNATWHHNQTDRGDRVGASKPEKEERGREKPSDEEIIFGDKNALPGPHTLFNRGGAGQVKSDVTDSSRAAVVGRNRARIEEPTASAKDVSKTHFTPPIGKRGDYASLADAIDGEADNAYSASFKDSNSLERDVAIRTAQPVEAGDNIGSKSIRREKETPKGGAQVSDSGAAKGATDNEAGKVKGTVEGAIDAAENKTTEALGRRLQSQQVEDEVRREVDRMQFEYEGRLRTAMAQQESQWDMKLQQLRDQLDEERGSALQEKLRMDQRQQQLVLQVQDLELRLDQANRRADSLLHTSSHAERQVDTVKTEYQAAESRCVELRKQLTMLQGTVDALRQQVKVEQSSNSRLQCEWEHEQRMHATFLRKKSELDGLLEKSEEGRLAADRCIRSLQADLKDSHLRNDQLTTRYTKLQNDHDNLAKQLKEATMAVAEAQNSLTSKDSEAQADRAALDEFKRREKSQAEELVMLKDKLELSSDLLKSSGDLKAKLAAMTAQVDETQQQANMAKQEVNRAAVREEKLQLEVRVLNNNLLEARQENHMLRKRIGLLEKSQAANQVPWSEPCSPSPGRETARSSAVTPHSKTSHYEKQPLAVEAWGADYSHLGPMGQTDGENKRPESANSMQEEQVLYTNNRSTNKRSTGQTVPSLNFPKKGEFELDSPCGDFSKHDTYEMTQATGKPTANLTHQRNVSQISLAHLDEPSAPKLQDQKSAVQGRKVQSLSRRASIGTASSRSLKFLICLACEMGCLRLTCRTMSC